MKRVLYLFMCVMGFLGCNQFGVISDNTAQKALDIVYEETQNGQTTIVSGYFKNRNYKNMECRTTNITNVEGKYNIKICFLKNVNTHYYELTDFHHLFQSPDVLVAFIPTEKRDIVLLQFIFNADKNDFFKGIPLGKLIVNLKTHKIAELS